MSERRLIRSLRLRNILSYGEEAQELELFSLNVIIGPNNAGKTNVVNAISLLRSTRADFAQSLRERGGVGEWLWKGAKRTPVAEIDATVYYPEGRMPLRHRLSFTSVGQRAELVDEAIEDERTSDPHATQPYFYYRYQSGRPVLSVFADLTESGKEGRKERRLRREDLKPDQSVLSQKVDKDLYPEITFLNDVYLDDMSIYRVFNVTQDSELRKPVRTDLPEDSLLEDGSNLALVLNDMQHRGLKPRILELLRKFYFAAEDLTVKIQGGSAQLYLHEKGLRTPIPATRLSEGTIRFLCLVAILYHPTPPSLVCLEEPELSLHPDIIPSLAEMLDDASERTQVIVTTHSEALVSAFSARPDSVLVCERDQTGSRLRRLDPAALEKWLEKYTLGQLWTMGEIGGTRW